MYTSCKKKKITGEARIFFFVNSLLPSIVKLHGFSLSFLLVVVAHSYDGKITLVVSSDLYFALYAIHSY
jgi:hypothetical protein